MAGGTFDREESSNESQIVGLASTGLAEELSAIVAGALSGATEWSVFSTHILHEVPSGLVLYYY